MKKQGFNKNFHDVEIHDQENPLPEKIIQDPLRSDRRENIINKSNASTDDYSLKDYTLKSDVSRGIEKFRNRRSHVEKRHSPKSLGENMDAINTVSSCVYDKQIPFKPSYETIDFDKEASHPNISIKTVETSSYPSVRYINRSHQDPILNDLVNKNTQSFSSNSMHKYQSSGKTRLTSFRNNHVTLDIGDHSSNNIVGTTYRRSHNHFDDSTSERRRELDTRNFSNDNINNDNSGQDTKENLENKRCKVNNSSRYLKYTVLITAVIIVVITSLVFIGKSIILMYIS